MNLVRDGKGGQEGDLKRKKLYYVHVTCYDLYSSTIELTSSTFLFVK